MLPWAYTRVHKPNGISIGLVILSSTRKSDVGHMPGHGLSPKIAPWHGRSGRHLIHSFGPPESSTQTASRSVQPFLYSSSQTVPILYNGPPLPLIIVPSYSDLTLSNTRFVGSTRVLNPNDLDRFNPFAWLITVTNRQTVRPRYSVCNNRPHLRT